MTVMQRVSSSHSAQTHLPGDSNGSSKENSPGPEYSAHSEGDVLVILDVSPDQSMIDEGVAREVVNRMQKLRKKGNLVPTDPVTLHWSTEDAALAAVIASHKRLVSEMLLSEIQERKRFCNVDRVSWTL